MGAGKSEVLAHLKEKYGACVIQADQVGHKVMEPGGEAYEAVLAAFPDQKLLRPDGTIDRGILGSIVFADREKLEILNAIIHPAVKKWICQEIEIQRQQGCRLCVIEAALLIEDRYEQLCGELWYIYADEEVRRERLKASRGYSDEKVASIFKNQLSEKEFRSHCQTVIENSGDFAKTCRQIAGLLGER